MKIIDDTYRIDSLLDIMRGCMREGSVVERREGRPSDCFVYVLEGAVDYRFPDCTCSVAAGSVMYLPRGSTYQIVVSEEYHHIYIDFEFERAGMEPVAMEKLESLEGLFRRALHRWLKGSGSSMLICTGILYEIYGQMMEKQRSRYVSRADRQAAVRAADRMLERLGDREMHLTDVAEHVGVSAAHLRRLFHAVYGVPPISYLQQMRVQQAKRQLIETDQSIEKIAGNCGFCNAYYFSRVFKSLTGTPPSIYRLENGR